jgi:AbrB family looped-hinge helix DNA binding protein
MPTSTITSKGQTTIPKEIRDLFNLTPGTKVDFVVQPDGTLVLRPATLDIRDLRDAVKVKGYEPLTVDGMHDAVAAAAVEKYRRSRR